LKRHFSEGSGHSRAAQVLVLGVGSLLRRSWLQEVPSLPRCQLEPASGPGERSSRSVTRERTLPFQAPVLLLPALTTLAQCLLLLSSCPECRTARTDQPLPGDDGMVLGAASLANFILRAFCRLTPLLGLSELMNPQAPGSAALDAAFPGLCFLILRPIGAPCQLVWAAGRPIENNRGSRLPAAQAIQSGQSTSH
jgi:hypothetical protein